MKLLALINYIRTNRWFLAYLFIFLTAYAPAELTRVILKWQEQGYAKDFNVCPAEIALIWVGYLIGLVWFIKAVRK